MEKIENAKRFHDLYEGLAPKYGYKTREDTKEFDPESPNGKLMIEVVNTLIAERERRLLERLIEKCDELEVTDGYYIDCITKEDLQELRRSKEL